MQTGPGSWLQYRGKCSTAALQSQEVKNNSRQPGSTLAVVGALVVVVGSKEILNFFPLFHFGDLTILTNWAHSRRKWKYILNFFSVPFWYPHWTHWTLSKSKEVFNFYPLSHFGILTVLTDITLREKVKNFFAFDKGSISVPGQWGYQNETDIVWSP